MFFYVITATLFVTLGTFSETFRTKMLSKIEELLLLGLGPGFIYKNKFFHTLSCPIMKFIADLKVSLSEESFDVADGVILEHCKSDT